MKFVPHDVNTKSIYLAPFPSYGRLYIKFSLATGVASP